MEGVDPSTAEALKFVRRFFKMTLFGYPKIDNGLSGSDEIVINYSLIAGLFIIEICESERVTERVDFIFTLPNPRIVERQIVGVTVAVLLNVECIGIRVDSYVSKLTNYETSDNRTDLGVVLSQRKIMRNLSRGVSEPHCRNIACVKKC